MAVVDQYGQPYFPAYPMVMPGAQQQVSSLRALCTSTGTPAFNISERNLLSLERPKCC